MKNEHIHQLKLRMKVCFLILGVRIRSMKEAVVQSALSSARVWGIQQTLVSGEKNRRSPLRPARHTSDTTVWCCVSNCICIPTSMFLDSVILFSLAMSSVICTALAFLFWESSHLGDSGMNLHYNGRTSFIIGPQQREAPPAQTDSSLSRVDDAGLGWV